MVQRSGTSASVTIAGNVGGGTHDLEYSLDGGAWTALLAAQTGAFSTTLTVNQGVHRITVRQTDVPSVYVTIDNFGVGEVFGIGGQSNAVGQLPQQFYSDATGKLEGLAPWCSIFNGNYQWYKLSDPTDGNFRGWTDAVNDPGQNLGSIWPLVATSIVAALGVPVAFIPGAKNSSGIDDWQPGADHQDRTTLYGALTYRCLQAGSSFIRGMLFWQGETNALIGTSTADYATKVATVANAWNTDLGGCKLIPVLLQQASGYTEVNRLKIVQGNLDAIAANPTKFGVAADFQNLVANDAFHLTTNVNGIAAATGYANVPMATAIKNTFGW